MKAKGHDKMKRSIREAFKLADDVVSHWQKYPDQFVAIPAASPLAGQLFSPERQRLLAVVKERGPFGSVDDLAKALHRDSTRVGRDLAPLVQAGLIRTVQHGKRKRVEPTNRPLLIQ